MDPILTGFGLASAAGPNAYIPFLLLGVAGRLGYADLSAPYTIRSSNAGLAVLAVLLTVELLADKVRGSITSTTSSTPSSALRLADSSSSLAPGRGTWTRPWRRSSGW